MTTFNFDAAFRLTVGEEGGYDTNPKDRGNWTGGVVGVGELRGTKYGVSAAAFPRLDIKNLTLAQARALYARNYWALAGCDRLPEGVDAVVFDAAVNHGVNGAIRLLQRAVGVFQDGIIGPVTLKAVDDIGPSQVISRFRGVREAFFRAAAANNPNEAEDLNGWLNRNARVTAAALAMTQQGQTA